MLLCAPTSFCQARHSATLQIASWIPLSIFHQLKAWHTEKETSSLPSPHQSTLSHLYVAPNTPMLIWHKAHSCKTHMVHCLEFSGPHHNNLLCNSVWIFEYKVESMSPVKIQWIPLTCFEFPSVNCHALIPNVHHAFSEQLGTNSKTTLNKIWI